MNAVTNKPRYRSPTYTERVEVSLSEFTDDEVRKEHEHRIGRIVEDKSVELEPEDEPKIVRGTDLRRIRALILCRQDGAALEATRVLICDALGTAL